MEIWGLDPAFMKFNAHFWLNKAKIDSTPYEKLHLKFCKWSLYLPKRASNTICRAEHGRYPLFFDIVTSAAKYWLRLESDKMANPLLKDTHRFLKFHSQFSGTNWYSRLNTILTSLNMDISEYGDSYTFIKLLKTAFTEKYEEDFKKDLHDDNHSKYETFKTIYNQYEIQDYLLNVGNSHHRQTISKLRTCCHKLHIETGRYKKQAREERKCTICNADEIETEKHFLLNCETLSNIRVKLFQNVQNYHVNFFDAHDTTKLSVLLNPDEKCASATGFYIHKMYNKRWELLNSK